MLIINEIDAALAKSASYEKKVSLFEKYGKNPSLLRTFKQKRDRQMRKLLDYHLKKLRWKPGIKLYKKDGDEERGKWEIFKSVDTRDIEEIYREHLESKNTPKTIYPSIIEKAIQDRQKAVNQREKAGRTLTENADSLSKDERAELVQTQKKQHKIVMATTAVVNTWKRNGGLPKPIEEKSKSKLSPEEISKYEEEWKFNLRKLSRAKNSVEKWKSEGDKNKLNYHQVLFDSSDKRLNELAEILGKKRKR